MIDEFKIYSIPVTIDELLLNPLLDFPLNVNETGEFNTKDQHCDFKKLIISINKAKVTRKMQGSLHIHWNGGLHNYNDFSFQDVCETIIDIEKNLHIDSSWCILNNLAYGVNLITEFDPTDLIKDLTIHSGNPFKNIPEGIGVSCEHSQYYIKIYNKGFQNKLPYNVLRVEIKVRTMDYLHSKRINVWTLADLMNIEYHKRMARDLLERFNEIIFYDNTIETGLLSTKDQLILSNARIPDYWIDLPDKNKKDQFRKKYDLLFKENVKRDWRKIVGPLIKGKTNFLINVIPQERESSMERNDKVAENLPIMKTLNETTPEISDGVFLQPHKSLEDVKDEKSKVSYSANGNINSFRADPLLHKISYGVFEKNNIAPLLISSADIATENINGHCIDFVSILDASTEPEVEPSPMETNWDITGLKDFFRSISLPSGPLKLDQCRTITNVEKFINANFSTVLAQNGKSTYKPYFDDLVLLKSILTTSINKI